MTLADLDEVVHRRVSSHAMDAGGLPVEIQQNRVAPVGDARGRSSRWWDILPWEIGTQIPHHQPRVPSGWRHRAWDGPSWRRALEGVAGRHPGLLEVGPAMRPPSRSMALVSDHLRRSGYFCTGEDASS